MRTVKQDKYKWDGDSRDERESEFVETGFSTTTMGAYHSNWAQSRARGQRRRKPRLARMLWPMLIALGLGALLLYGAVGHFRH